MRADKPVPGGRLLAFGSRWNAMTLEDIPHSLVTKGIAPVGQSTHNTIITPGAILLRHAHHQGLQLRVDRGSPWSLALPGTIKLLRHKLTVPAEHRVGLDEVGDFRQRLLAQLLADVHQRLALAIAEVHTPLDLIAEYPVLRRQVLVTQQPFLINSPRDVCELCDKWTKSSLDVFW